MRRIIGAAGFVLVLAPFVSCGSSESSDNAAGRGGGAGAPDASSAGSGGSGGSAGDSSVADSASEQDASDDALRDAAITDSGDLLIRIAEGQDKPSGIALHDNDVYWANEGSGTILRCPKAGCEGSPTPVLSGVPGLRGIAIYESTLYFTTSASADAALGPTLLKCDLAACGGGGEPIEPGGSGAFGSFAVAVNASGVYVAMHFAIRSCSLAGCPDGAVKNLAQGGGMRGLALAAGRIYFTGIGRTALSSCPLSGCVNPEDLTIHVSNLHMPLSVASDATNIYFTQFNPLMPEGGTIVSCPLAGCDAASAKLLVAGEALGPYAVAVDATHLYYTDYVNGRVLRQPKDAVDVNDCPERFFTDCAACPESLQCDGG